MFERFTDRARRVTVLAQEEASRLDHAYIGTEHVLLGLLAEGEGVAAKALGDLGITIDGVRDEVLVTIGRGTGSLDRYIPFTPRAKKVMEFSLREALQLGHNYIGTEHVLLGLVREGEGVAAQILIAKGADLNSVRRQVIQVLAGYKGATPANPKVDSSIEAIVAYVADVLADPTLQRIIAGRVYTRLRQESTPEQQTG